MYNVAALFATYVRRAKRPWKSRGYKLSATSHFLIVSSKLLWQRPDSLNTKVLCGSALVHRKLCVQVVHASRWTYLVLPCCLLTLIALIPACRASRAALCSSDSPISCPKALLSAFNLLLLRMPASFPCRRCFPINNSLGAGAAYNSVSTQIRNEICGSHDECISKPTARTTRPYMRQLRVNVIHFVYESSFSRPQPLGKFRVRAPVRKVS